jgi:hypothetical protein
VFGRTSVIHASDLGFESCANSPIMNVARPRGVLRAKDRIDGHFSGPRPHFRFPISSNRPWRLRLIRCRTASVGHEIKFDAIGIGDGLFSSRECGFCQPEPIDAGRKIIELIPVRRRIRIRRSRSTEKEAGPPRQAPDPGPSGVASGQLGHLRPIALATYL